jgi:hypothetical protein
MSQASLRDGEAPIGVGIWTERVGRRTPTRPTAAKVRSAPEQSAKSAERLRYDFLGSAFAQSTLTRELGETGLALLVPNGAVVLSLGCTLSGRAQALKRAHTRVHVDLTEGRLP